MIATLNPITAAAGPDPVLAMIEAHRAAYAAWDRASHAWNHMDPRDPGYEAAEAAAEEPSRREREAMLALLAGRPTTVAGLWALTAYLPEAVRKVNPAPDTEAQAALDALREGAMRLGLAQALAPPAPAHPDAALLALGMPFLTAWRDEGAADPVSTGERREVPAGVPTFDEAHARCSGVVDSILALPAATVEGLGIKALALAWCNTEIGSPAAPMPEPHDLSTASDKALLWQVQAGAAQILASDAGTGVETPASAAAAPTATALDLSRCSTPQIARLYEALHGVYEHIGATGQRPCFRAGGHLLTLAGAILDDEADRIGAMLSDCADAVAARTPSSDEDRDEALLVRVSHAMLSNGRIADRALMHDLMQSWGAAGHIVTEVGR